MKGEDILNALGGIDSDILEKNSGQLRRRKHVWPALVAACLVLAIGLGLLAGGGHTQDPVCYMPTLRQEGQVSPGTEKNLLIGHHAIYESGFVVTARAIERVDGVYETPARYGSMTVERLCIYKMQVLDSLDEGLPEEFYYAIPEKYDEDLTKYETLLISMYQQGLDYQLIHCETGRLDTFGDLFYESWPFYGDIIAFKDGVFDISLWKCENWVNAPYSIYRFMTHYGVPNLLVEEGTTLEAVLQELRERRQKATYEPRVYYTNDLTGEAAEALEYVQSCAPGTYVGSARRYQNNYGGEQVYYTRYINGYPTNEYIGINRETGKVEYSQIRFAQEDLKGLPDLAAYIRDLDLDALTPPNEDVTGRELLCRVVYGWYEKTEHGVEALVKIAWAYQGDQGHTILDCMFIRLTDAGSQVLSADEITVLIGESDIIDVWPESWYRVKY